MDLYVVRHAIAVDGAGFRGPDAARELTREGREKFSTVVEALRRLGLAPKRIWTSPYIRARQTAEILARGLGGRIEETDLLAPGVPVRALFKHIAQSGDDPAVVVGHEPDLGGIVAAALGQRPGPALAMRKGAVAWIEFDPRPAEGLGRLALWLPAGAALRLVR